MASVQKSDDLKDMLKTVCSDHHLTRLIEFVYFNQEKERSMQLAEMMKQIDENRLKAMDLLKTIMPTHVAKKLLAGGMSKSIKCQPHVQVVRWALCAMYSTSRQ